jgi:hypothetical protein
MAGAPTAAVNVALAVYPVATMTSPIGPRQQDAWAATISIRNG